MKRIALLVLLAACPPTPAPAPPDVVVTVTDASSTTARCAGACQNMARLGCAEGSASTCAVTCQRLLPQKAAQAPIAFDVACIEAASSKAAVRACAGLGASACP